jgi:transposase
MTDQQNSTVKKEYKSKYNQGMLDTLVEILSNGVTITAACGYVGIDRKTYYNWMNKHPEFATAINAVRFQLEARLLARIEEHGKKDWKANAWILERKYPEDWSLKREVELNVNKSNGSNEVIEFLKQSREEDED